MAADDTPRHTSLNANGSTIAQCNAAGGSRAPPQQPAESTLQRVPFLTPDMAESALQNGIRHIYQGRPAQRDFVRQSFQVMDPLELPSGWSAIMRGTIPIVRLMQDGNVRAFAWSVTHKKWFPARVMGWTNANIRDPSWSDWAQVVLSMAVVAATKRMQFTSPLLTFVKGFDDSLPMCEERYGPAPLPLFPARAMVVPSPAESPQSRLHRSLAKARKAASALEDATAEAEAARTVRGHQPGLGAEQATGTLPLGFEPGLAQATQPISLLSDPESGPEIAERDGKRQRMEVWRF